MYLILLQVKILESHQYFEVSMSCITVREAACGGQRQNTKDAEIVTPFVEITISDGSTVQVGNESSQDSGVKNSAVVKSFQIGWSDGAGCVIEIVDESGGDFVKFFTRIAHGIDLDMFTIKCRWGWIDGRCVGGAGSQQSTSAVHTLYLNKIDVDFKAGRVLFKVTGTDIFRYKFEGRNEIVYGESGNIILGTERKPVALKDAIRRLSTESKPTFNVQFQPKDWDFSDPLSAPSQAATFIGPPRPALQGIHRGDGDDPISVIRNWVGQEKTQNGKPIIFSYDTVPDKTMILYEDPREKDAGCKAYCKIRDKFLGAFIVNGGNQSPVISFTPQIRWSWQTLASAGGHANPHGRPTLKNKDSKLAQNKEATEGKKSPTGQSGEAMTKPNDEELNKKPEEALDCKNMNMAANRGHQFSHTEPISADLRIQGRPDFDTHTKMYMSFLNLIVINPFHLRNVAGATNDCAQWLANPECNTTLSNTNWNVLGWSHEISEGAYTTTLKVKLYTPGVDFSIGKNVGQECGGVKIPDPSAYAARSET